MINGIIFDLDGVLADTSSMWIGLYRNITHKVGISRTLSDDEITKNFGEKYELVLEGLVGKANMGRALPMLENKIYSEDWLNSLKPTPHSPEVLERLGKIGLKMAVVSGNKSDILHKILKSLGFENYFQTTVGADQVRKAKPDPESLLKAISVLNLKKSEVIFIGDATNDVKAARAAGIRVGVVLTGALKEKKAKELEPDWILPDLSKLLNILK